MSIAAGVAAVTSAFPEWHLSRVEIALGFTFLLMVGNLRGIRESGRIFAAPTYVFITCILALMAAGAWRYATGSITPLAAVPAARPEHLGTLSAFMLLTAFAP